MRWNVPTRFTLEWWVWIGNGALVFGLATGVALYLQGITNAYFFVLVIFGSLVGDIVLALAFEALAPTDITIGPGDKSRHDSEVRELATVVDGFEDGREGKVTVRGETWRARQTSPDRQPIQAGTKVRVLGREGLVLLIAEATAQTTGGDQE